MATTVQGIDSGSGQPAKAVERIRSARRSPKPLDAQDMVEDKARVLEFREPPQRVAPRTVDGPTPDDKTPDLDRGVGFGVDLEAQAKELSAEAMGKGGVVRRKS